MLSSKSPSGPFAGAGAGGGLGLHRATVRVPNVLRARGVLASALLSTSGVFLALLITGKTFNISSFMGLIMVIGIVAKNGILLLDADQRFRLEGSSARDAMIEAGERRLRPILMTALATVAGMVPLSLAIGAGSQMRQPLAIAVIGGLIASLALPDHHARGALLFERAFPQIVKVCWNCLQWKKNDGDSNRSRAVG